MTKTESLANLAQSIDYGLTASAVKSSAGPRFLRITDIQDGLVNWGSVPSCNCTPEDLQRFPLAVGDIVFARTGATTGKSFLIRELPNDPVVFASYLIRVRPKGVDPKFLAHFFNSAKYWRQITRGANGSTQPGVNATTLGELRVPVPPINEQKRIAAILDKADAIRRKREQAIQLADEFLRSLFLDMFGDPARNPKGWPVKSLGDVVNFTTGSLDSNAAIHAGKYPFFTCAREDMRIDKYAFDCEALLLAGNNANADYSVKHYEGKFNAYQRTYVITKRLEDFTYEYLRMFLQHRLAELKWRSKGTNTKYLTLGILKDLEIYCPPAPLQLDFKRVSIRVRGIIRTHAILKEQSDELLTGLVQQSFTGEILKPIECRGVRPTTPSLRPAMRCSTRIVVHQPELK